MKEWVSHLQTVIPQMQQLGLIPGMEELSAIYGSKGEANTKETVEENVSVEQDTVNKEEAKENVSVEQGTVGEEETEENVSVEQDTVDEEEVEENVSVEQGTVSEEETKETESNNAEGVVRNKELSTSIVLRTDQLGIVIKWIHANYDRFYNAYMQMFLRVIFQKRRFPQNTLYQFPDSKARKIPK